MASYAIPLTANAIPNNHHGHGHTRSQHRKAFLRPQVLQRIDSESNTTLPQLKSDSLAHTPQINGNAHSLSPLHLQSPSKPHHINRTPSPLASPSLSLEPNAVIDSDRKEGVSMALPIASPARTQFDLDGTLHSSPESSSANVVYAEHRTRRFSWDELLTSFLFTTPFLLISILSSYGHKDSTAEVTPTIEQLTASVLYEGRNALRKDAELGLVGVLAIAATIFVLLGVYDVSKSTGERTIFVESEGRRLRWGQSGQLKACLGRLEDIAVTVGALALPFYASINLGGSRVALTLFVAVVARTSPATVTKRPGGLLRSSTWKVLPKTRPLVLIFFLMEVFADITASVRSPGDLGLGYTALILSILLVPVPFFTPPDRKKASTNEYLQTASKDAAKYTMTNGLGVLAFVLIWSVFDPSPLFFLGSFPSLGLCLLTILTSAYSLIVCDFSSLDTMLHAGLAFGGLLSILPLIGSSSLPYSLVQVVLAVGGYTAVQLDKNRSSSGEHDHGYHSDHSHHDHSSHFHQGQDPSSVTKYLLRTFRNWPILYNILVEHGSRRLFYFMMLNFAFMLIQLSYGILTGSLGLLADSIHMFFDCFGLLVGLIAKIMCRWPPTERFPYGYGKVETLSGFANGIFLVIISVEIVLESIGRLHRGTEMHRLDELLVISVIGGIVNLVGLLSTGHHGHDHGHGHSHGENENEEGIRLHILSDLLGSVAVVASTILIKAYGWNGFDPVASVIIAVGIIFVTWDLIKKTATKLLMGLPDEAEYNLRDTLAGVSGMRGVAGYKAPKFWLDESESAHDHDHFGESHSHAHDCLSTGDGHDHPHTPSSARSPTHHHHDDHHESPVLGSIHIFATRGSNLENVRERVTQYLRGRGLNIIVQVEREGEGSCWCSPNKLGGSISR